MVKIMYFGGVPIFDALVRVEPRGTKFYHEKLETLLACTVLIQCQGVTDRRTDRQTYGHLDDG